MIRPTLNPPTPKHSSTPFPFTIYTNFSLDHSQNHICIISFLYTRRLIKTESSLLSDASVLLLFEAQYVTKHKDQIMARLCLNGVKSWETFRAEKAPLLLNAIQWTREICIIRCRHRGMTR